MNLAVSSSFFPGLDFETLAARAKEFGFDAVELVGAACGAESTGANVFLIDPAKISRAFASAGVGIACVDGLISYTGEKPREAESAEELKHAVSIATQLNCRIVTLAVRPGAPGSSAMATAVRLGDWLLPLGDWAADHGAMLVVKNGPAIRTARQMWSMLDRLRHPAIACCWEVLAGTSAGEGPWVSVPVLNSKIQYVHVAPPTVGEAEIPMRRFLTRLQGVGYSGYVTIAPGLEGFPSSPETALPQAARQLRAWLAPPVGAKSPHKKHAATAK